MEHNQVRKKKVSGFSGLAVAREQANPIVKWGKKWLWVLRVLVPFSIGLLFLEPLLCLFQFSLEKFRSVFTEEEGFNLEDSFHFLEDYNYSPFYNKHSLTLY